MTPCQVAPSVSYSRVDGSLADLKVEELAPYSYCEFSRAPALGRSAVISCFNASPSDEYHLVAWRVALAAALLKRMVPGVSAAGWDTSRVFDYIRSAADAFGKITWDMPAPSFQSKTLGYSTVLRIDPHASYTDVFSDKLGERAAERLRTFFDLQPGWDGSRAEALDIRSVRLAADFLSSMGASFDHLAVSVFMTFGGEIALNWPVADGGFVEIRFGVDQIELSPPGIDAEELYFSSDDSGLIEAVHQYL